MKSVLILDSNQRSSLAVTRSLGMHGISVINADSSSTSLSGCSKYSNSYHNYPDPKSYPKEFISSLIRLTEINDIGMIIPMTELSTTLLLENRSSFSNISIPFPELDKIDLLANKCSLMRLATELNIPTPDTYYATPDDEVDLNSFTYPIILKPGKSWLLDDEKWIHTTVQLAENIDKAKSILNTDRAFKIYPFMIQECIQGEGQAVFALYNHGKAIAFFSHRRLREKPPWGGVSVLSESIEIDPTMLKHAKSLLDKAHWHGIAMVEFKVSENGTPYLMEVNTRFWGSLQLSIDAGIDFPWLLYQTANDKALEAIIDYKIGKRLRWLLGDLDSLYLTLRDKSGNYPSKIKACLQFATPDWFRTKHEVNRWYDLRPFWWEIKQYLADLFK